ncbi:hypothetical protein BDP27DRAFT_1175383, partial [Rhodocollybia butyracea]
PCKEPTNPNIVTLVDTNGIHGTRISYCGCNRDPNRLQQLMNTRLFPGSVKFPTTIMRFRVMDDYTKHNLASKKSSYDYIHALCSLSDGFFTQEVADPHPQFIVATRIWRKLHIDKHTGQIHNLSESDAFPHRTPGSIMHYCLACPEDGFNIEKGWEQTPPE